VLWYLPVPRRWWSLAILLVTFLVPCAAGFVGGGRLRRLLQEIEDERLSRHPDVS
jgi:hypothetical protein